MEGKETKTYNVKVTLITGEHKYLVQGRIVIKVESTYFMR